MTSSPKLVRERQFMNTTISVQVVKAAELSTVEISDAIEAAFGEFDRIVKQYTRFNQDSELSNLNRRTGEWTEVNSEFFMLISKMLQMARATSGDFDPTVIDFLETYGYDANYDFSKLDKPDLDQSVKKLAQSRPSWRQIQLDEKGKRVKLAHGQRLDLGGIGKGYAIDCAAEKLKHTTNFLIDAGGDIRCSGVNMTGEPWKINLLHKQSEKASQVIGQIAVSDISVACSGSWARRVKQFHHILDPRTGAPVESMQTVYVSAPEATTADSWATALFVGGTDLLSRLPSGMGALLLDKDNKAIMAGEFPKFNS